MAFLCLFSYKLLLDEVFVISRIIKVDNPYRDFDYSGYHKTESVTESVIIVLLYIERIEKDC